MGKGLPGGEGAGPCCFCCAGGTAVFITWAGLEMLSGLLTLDRALIVRVNCWDLAEVC